MNKISFRHRVGVLGKKLGTPSAVLLGTGLVCLSACQESTLEDPSDPDNGEFVIVKVPKFNAQASADAKSTVELFQFSENLLKKKVAVELPQNDSVALEKGKQTRLYAISGYSLSAEEGVTDETEFSRILVYSPENAVSVPIFFSAVSELDPPSGELSLELKRAVARIDINNIDPDLTVSGATLVNAPAASYAFPVEGSVCESSSVSYSQTFDTGLQGLERGVFTMFESADSLIVTITGIKDDNPVEISVKTPAAKRNKVYTVNLKPDDPTPPTETTTVIPTVTVADWEQGEDYNPGPDTSEGLTLDVEASGFPSSVRYDETNGIVEIPADGIDNLNLAFRSDLRVDIANVFLSGSDVEKDDLENKGAFSIKGYKVTESGDDIITTYTISIQPQLICRSEYFIDLGIRKASMANVYDYIRLRVAPHPKQIHTVVMGGVEWMCFNATSQNLEDQIFPLEGLSIEDMYREHYVDCVGNYFQYGKENPFSPWTSNDPNQFADQPRDIPWKSPEKMPLPEGYHVASAAEWKALMPNGITLPAAWKTASGDSIKGSVVTLPGTLVTPSEATNNRNFMMRYVIFESITTGNKLFVPIAGIKTNNTAEVPGHGKLGFDLRSSYWLADDRYCWLIDYKATPENEDGAVLSQSRWNYDGFMSVRGVKD